MDWELEQLDREAAAAVHQFLAGHSHAFQTLIQLFGPRVIRIVRKMVAGFHDGEDLYNEIWLKVAQNLHKYDPSLPFHAWLYRITSNACIDFLRKKKDIVLDDEQLYHHVQKYPLSQTNNPESTLLTKEFYSELHELLAQLDETDRIIMTLRFMEDMSYEAIGEIVHMSKNTVGTRLFRARKQIREIMERQQEERGMTDAAL